MLLTNLLSKERSFTKKGLFLLRKKKAGNVSETLKGVSDCFNPTLIRV